LSLIPGKTDEAIAAPGEHGTEHLPAGLTGPVHHQVLARRRHPGPVAAPGHLPRRLHLLDRPLKAAQRPRVPRCLGHRQQALRRDPAIGLPQPLFDQPPHRGGFGQVRRSPPGLPTGAALHHPLHRLRGRATQRRSAPIAPHLLIRIDDVHLVPRCLQRRLHQPECASTLPNGPPVWIAQRAGTFVGVPRGLSLALSGYFYMALDTDADNTRHPPTGPPKAHSPESPSSPSHSRKVEATTIQ